LGTASSPRPVDRPVHVDVDDVGTASTWSQGHPKRGLRNATRGSGGRNRRRSRMFVRSPPSRKFVSGVIVNAWNPYSSRGSRAHGRHPGSDASDLIGDHLDLSASSRAHADAGDPAVGRTRRPLGHVLRRRLNPSNQSGMPEVWGGSAKRRARDPIGREVGAHVRRATARHVQADVSHVEMRHAYQIRLGRLADHRPAAAVDDRARDHHRQPDAVLA